MFWAAAVAITVALALVICCLPLRARVDAIWVGRVWEVRVSWLTPAGRWRLWRLHRRGYLRPGPILCNLLRRQGRPWLEQAGGPRAGWIPLLVLLHLARLESAALRIRFGTGDAALTGIAAGGLWSLAGAGAAWFEEQFGPLRRPPRVRVEPNFERACWEVRAACIGSSRPRDIIVALLWLLVTAVGRARHRGVKSAPWKGIPSKA